MEVCGWSGYHPDEILQRIESPCALSGSYSDERAARMEGCCTLRMSSSDELVTRGASEGRTTIRGFPGNGGGRRRDAVGKSPGLRNRSHPEVAVGRANGEDPATAAESHVVAWRMLWKGIHDQWRPRYTIA